MSKALLNRIAKAKAALQPATGSSTGSGASPCWRQSDIDPTKYRPEFGGEWVSETEMMTLCPPNGRAPRVVTVRGTWSELAK